MALTDQINTLAQRIATEVNAVRAGSLGVVFHGADPNVARPSGYDYILWLGTVEPVNRALNDLRINLS